MNEYHPDRSLSDWAYYLTMWVYFRTIGRVVLWWFHQKEDTSRD